MAPYDPTLRDEWKREGYSKEEKYFHELDRELIDRLKRSAEAPTGNVFKSETSDLKERAGDQKQKFFSKLRRKLFPKEFSPDLF